MISLAIFLLCQETKSMNSTKVCSSNFRNKLKLVLISITCTIDIVGRVLVTRACEKLRWLFVSSFNSSQANQIVRFTLLDIIYEELMLIGAPLLNWGLLVSLQAIEILGRALIARAREEFRSSFVFVLNGGLLASLQVNQTGRRTLLDRIYEDFVLIDAFLFNWGLLVSLQAIEMLGCVLIARAHEEFRFRACV